MYSKGNQSGSVHRECFINMYSKGNQSSSVHRECFDVTHGVATNCDFCVVDEFKHFLTF